MEYLMACVLRSDAFVIRTWAQSRNPCWGLRTQWPFPILQVLPDEMKSSGSGLKELAQQNRDRQNARSLSSSTDSRIREDLWNSRRNGQIRLRIRQWVAASSAFEVFAFLVLLPQPDKLQICLVVLGLVRSFVGRREAGEF